MGVEPWGWRGGTTSGAAVEEAGGEGLDVLAVDFGGAVGVDIGVDVGGEGLAGGEVRGIEDGGDEVGDVVHRYELVVVHVAAGDGGAVAGEVGGDVVTGDGEGSAGYQFVIVS